MKIRRRLRRVTSAPNAGRHRWVAAVLVVVVLVALAVWIGAELSDWPPPPPSARR